MKATMSEGSSPKRARLDYDDNLKDDHYDKYKSRDHDDQGSFTHTRRKRGDPDDDDMKDGDEMKGKNVPIDATRREHTLVMRLTNKEQELQECMNQIQEMKQAQTQNTAQLRSMLLDPAINLVFQKMAREMEEHKEKLKQKQNELSAWKFTPDSQTGMRLMAKCRMLLQENGDLGKMISSGRTSRLEGEITLQKALVTEMKKNQKELDEFVGELEDDVEGMQGMIFMLKQQLKEAREQIVQLQEENNRLRNSTPAKSVREIGGKNITTTTGQQSMMASLSSSSTSSSSNAAMHSDSSSTTAIKFTHQKGNAAAAAQEIPQVNVMRRTPDNVFNPVSSSSSSSFPPAPTATERKHSSPSLSSLPSSSSNNSVLNAGGQQISQQHQNKDFSPVTVKADPDSDFQTLKEESEVSNSGRLAKEQKNSTTSPAEGSPGNLDSVKVSVLSDVSSNSRGNRTSPCADSEIPRTGENESSVNNNCPRESKIVTGSVPLNGDALTTRSAGGNSVDSDALTNRTSCVGDVLELDDPTVSNCVEEMEEGSRHFDSAVSSIMSAKSVESDGSGDTAKCVELTKPLGITNGVGGDYLSGSNL